VGCRVHALHDLVQHLVGASDPQVLGPLDADDLRLGHDREPLPRLRRLQVVVVLGHERHERGARLRPGPQVLRTGEPQRRAQQDRARHARVAAVHERQVRAEAPADEPDPRQVEGLHEVQGRGHVVLLGHTAAVRALAGALGRAGAAGVEPQHREVGERRQPVRHLLQQVAVHHPAVGGQGVQAHQGGDRRTVQRQRQLADEGQAVGRVQRDGPPVGGQHRVGADLGHRPRP
jgi:hypothetical protein